MMKTIKILNAIKKRIPWTAHRTNVLEELQLKHHKRLFFVYLLQILNYLATLHTKALTILRE